MLEPKQTNDDLQAAVDNNKIFIRVLGRGSFKVSATLKQFINSMIDHLKISVIVLDMKECVGMDSTFMGVLAGLSGRLKNHDVQLDLIHISDKNANLLATLGVDQLLSFYSNNHGHSVPKQITQSLPTQDATKKNLAKTALTAHEELVRISEENRPKFKRVIEFLKADVDRLD